MAFIPAWNALLVAPGGYNFGMSDWQSAYHKEIEAARAARQQKNEGQARVCARRAAGVVIREYYRQRGQPIRASSAYELLKMLTEDLSQPAAVRQSAAALTLRVNEAFNLPVATDLVKEAESIAAALSASRQV
jgi:HEPN domain-containing protein